MPAHPQTHGGGFLFYQTSVETLFHEIEATGASLDETQEQSKRLLEQLREKEDASFANVTARMQAEAAAKLALEQRKEDVDARSKLLAELDAKTKLVGRLQELERTGREEAWLQQKRVSDMDARLEVERQQHSAKLAAADTSAVAVHDAREQNEVLSRRLQEYVLRPSHVSVPASAVVFGLAQPAVSLIRILSSACHMPS
jgi:hypothetical protein